MTRKRHQKPAAFRPGIWEALFYSGNRGVAIIFLLSLTLYVGVQYARPILDGDLYFHLQYAKQIIGRQTLLVDHTLYSWTPSSNDLIYCSWFSELVLYGLWSMAGLAGIFALRYTVIAIVLGLVWRFACQCGLGLAPLTATVLAATAWLISAGTLPKPELFTLLFFTIMIFCYATMRVRAEIQHYRGRILYVIPVCMMVWVNSHGGFILAAPFLAVTGAAEAGLYVAKSPSRLSRALLHNLLVTYALTFGAIFLTPYGTAYIIQLARDYIVQKGARADVQWNNAYASIFDAHLADYGTWLVVMVTGMFWLARWAFTSNRRLALCWMPLALATLGYVPFYLAFLRSTQFLPLV